MILQPRALICTEKITSVNTEERVVIVEHVGLSQRETVIHVAAAGKREISPNSHDVPFDKLARGEEESRAASPEQVRIKTVCVAGNSVVRSSFLCGEAS